MKINTFSRLRRTCLLLLLCALGVCSTTYAQTLEERVALLEQQNRELMLRQEAEKQSKQDTKSKYAPQLHGIMRGKYEYQPDMDASRFEVRNARLSVSGALPLRSEYKLEVDLCDESKIKMKDAWVRINPWKTLRLSVGQQRMPFSIDAHRNPSAQYFANRSFIAKQVGDMRDVGFQAGYTFKSSGDNARTIAVLDAGLFNGSNLDNQKTAWYSDINYSARLQWFPVKGLTIVPSIQHTAIADREAHYTSLDFGTYYECGPLHLEAEYLHKVYMKDAFSDCNAVNAMAIYKMPFKSDKMFLQSMSYLARYDYMDDHSDGKNGFVSNDDANTPQRLAISDYMRHRMTLGLTFAVRNPYFPTDLRLNYEKYWYPHGGAKESEQDKIVAEIIVKF